MSTTQAALLEAPIDIAIQAIDEYADAASHGECWTGTQESYAAYLETARSKAHASIAALRAADAAQPEPVAYLARSRYGSQCHFGMKAAADAWAGDGGEVFEIPLRHLGLVSPSLAQPAPIAAQAGTPTIEAAHDMGAKGGPTVEAERLAFEAWMRGHCWRPGYWVGGEYNDLHTRGLWAAWRDRAALAAQAGPALAPLTEAQIVHAIEAAGHNLAFRSYEQDLECARAIERAHGIGATSPESTRPADASISGQRVDMAPSVPEIDYEAAIAECFKRTKYQQGTGGCVAFAKGAEWFRELVLAAAPQAPAPKPAHHVVDLLDAYKRACKLVEWANAAGTILESPQAMYEAAVELRDTLGRATHIAPQAPAEQQDEHDDEDGPLESAIALLETVNRVCLAPAEPAAQAVGQDATLPVHEVWREGYRITGESEGAVKLGEAQAATFEEACDIVCRGKADYDAKTRRVWGCRLFNNEADARKAFG